MDPRLSRAASVRMTDDQDPGGRIYFSSTKRTLADDDEICLLSVGVDIGSSTSHLVFSRIVLERLDARYIVTERETFYQSDILLTPYAAEQTIDARALDEFFAQQYRSAQVDPDEIDTGALILTGVAVRRTNARAIGELFARQAGKMVAVSAGDSLETVMAAYGSGAVARSIREDALVMNVDVGGGTSKLALARNGKVIAATALDVGARLVALGPAGEILRIEPVFAKFAQQLGLAVAVGRKLPAEDAQAIAAAMADALFAAMRGDAPTVGGAPLLRLDPLPSPGPIAAVTFSGGVAEYIYGWEQDSFGDLGAVLAKEIRDRVERAGIPMHPPAEAIRATVIGASQYTTQVSGSTIYVSPLDILPLRNVPVIAPEFGLDDAIDPAAVASAIRNVLKRLELARGDSPVAVFVPWQGSATFHRLDAFCRGVADGLHDVLAHGHPLVLAGDGDVGGLIGIHLREELKLGNPIVSVDGLELKEFDYIDIGAMLDSSGAVPVVIKSLIFPGDATGRAAVPTSRDSDIVRI
jgi:ethanolamine utilization protein EutA